MKFSTADILEAEKCLNRFRENTPDERVFYHLCFCVCAPQAPYPKNLSVINTLVARDFANKPIAFDDLRSIVRPVRFLRKADYLHKLYSMWSSGQFAEILRIRRDALHHGFYDYRGEWSQAREWLVKNVDGLGMKTASHFLRNIGYQNFAIIDTHILKFLYAISPRNTSGYLELERAFKIEADKIGMSPALLDALIWKQGADTSWLEFQY